jgi:hypothetical protein
VGRWGHRILVAAVCAVTGAAIFGGLLIIGTPSEERRRQLDNRRIDELRDVADAMDTYWTRHAALPASLEELSRERGIVIDPRDPETGQLYEYRILGQHTYELCACFSAAEEDRTLYEGFWAHSTGRQCFTLEARTVTR